MAVRTLELIMRLRKRKDEVDSLKGITKELTNLEKKVRQIQDLGRLKGDPIFKQDHSSLKVLRKELEGLQKQMTALSRAGPTTRAFGISPKMIEDFKKAKIQVLEFQDAVKNIGSNVKSIQALETAFNKLKNRSKEVKTTLVGTAQTFAKGGEIANKEAAQMAEAYELLRKDLVRIFKDIGLVSQKAFDPMRFTARRWQEELVKANKIVQGETKKTKAIQSELARQYKVTYNQIIAGSKEVINAKLEEITTEQKLKGALRFREQHRQAVEKLNKSYLEMVGSLKLSDSAVRSTSSHQERLNVIMGQATAILREYSGFENARASAIIKSVNAEQQMTTSLKFLGKQMAVVIKEYKELQRQRTAFREGSKNLAQNEVILKQRVELLGKQLNILGKTYSNLIAQKGKLSRANREESREWIFVQGQIRKTEERLKAVTASYERASIELRRAMNRTGDAVRAVERITSAGFANMIVSQAAWMAGFQVVFGTLDKFKAAMGAVVETQEAVVRAMRTARSETRDSAQIFDLFTDAILNARQKTGAALEDLGEILYQLGSAGLSAEESVAALDSTLATIQGTESDVREITKLVAGLYNNFAEQIAKVDGEIRVLSKDMSRYQGQVIETVSDQEKFLHINDLLVAAFRDNQVEMSEMKDGLKFMAQSGKAANLELEEMVGILAFLNNNLIKAGTAGRSMRVILSRMTKDLDKFATAFDIKIDPTEPLNFLEIMQKINERNRGTVISAADLGKIFKNLGLRGAEAFNLILRNVDKVNETIDTLKETSAGAAAEMQKIRLGDLARQAEIASARIEVLLRNMVLPLVTGLEMVVAKFNDISAAVSSLNEKTGGFLSFVLKLGSATATILGIAFAFTKMGTAFTWIVGVGTNLILKFKELGAAQKDNEIKTKTLSMRYDELRARLSLLVLKFKETQVAATQTSVAVSRSAVFMGRMSAAAKGVAAAFKTLSATMQAFIGMLVIMLAFKVFEWFDNLAEKRMQEHQELKESIKTQKAYVTNLGLMSKKLKASSELTHKNTKEFDDLQKILGLTTKEYKDDASAIEEVVSKTEKLIEATKSLNETTRQIFIEKEVRRLVKDFDKVRNSVVRLGDDYAALSGASGELFALPSIEDAKAALIDVNFAIAESLKLEKELNKLREVSDPQNRKEIDARIKAIEDYNVFLTREQAHLKNIVDTSRERVTVEDNLGKVMDKRTESADKIRKYEKELNTIFQKRAKEIRNSIKLMETIEATTEATKEFGIVSVQSFDALNARLQEVKRTQTLRDMRIEMDSLSSQLTALGKQQDSEKTLWKIWKDTEKLGRQGLKNIEVYRKELERLVDDFEELQRAIDESAFERLEKQFDIIGQSASAMQSGLESFIGTSTKFADSLDSVNKSLADSKQKIIELEGQRKLAETGTQKYISINRKLEAERRKTIIVAERQQRAERLLSDEVGVGIRSLEAMRERTEKFRREEEQVAMTLIDAEAAYKIARDSQGEYSSAKQNFLTIQRAFVDAQARTAEATRQEADNLRELSSRYTDVELKIRNQLSSSEGLLNNIRERVAKEKELLQTEAKSLQEANRQKEAIERLKTLRQDETNLIDKRRELQEKLIELDQKTGRVTAGTAYLESQRILVEAEREKLKLVEDKFDQTQKEEDVLKRLAVLTQKEIDSRKNAIEEIENLFDRVGVQFANLRKQVEQGIPIKLTLIEEIDAAEKVWDTLVEKMQKPIITQVIMKSFYGSPGATENYRGGMIKRASGGLVPAWVTNGEGYIPPGQVMGNLNALNTLNGGRATSRIPAGIARFAGPGGIDNIPAMLPKGSYVLSNKGMQAYERSLQQGAQTFQQGGEVNNEELIGDEVIDTRDFGTITLNVSSGDRTVSLPVQGDLKTLQTLRDELEREDLTRLQ